MTAREKAGHVLGKAVHPAALDRLYEIWPNAFVEVLHERIADDTKPWRMDQSIPTKRVTEVVIYATGFHEGLPMPEARTGRAVCHPNDNFERRQGIKMAFDRAFKQVPRPSRVPA